MIFHRTLIVIFPRQKIISAEHRYASSFRALEENIKLDNVKFNIKIFNVRDSARRYNSHLTARPSTRNIIK